MRFLSPGFLFALLTIAIPIIIHLFNFRKFKKVYFSNVRFLREVQIESSSRRQLKDRFILLCRILAIAFLVLAFARPYIPSADQAGGGDRQTVSIFIDNSYSMEAVNKEGTLLDEAKRRAREISAAYGLNDKYQLLTNDFAGKDQRLLSREDFLKAIDEVEISAAVRNLSEIISRQEEIFSSEPNSRKNIYVISDFQNNLLPEKSLGVDTSINVRLVKLKATPQPNISIDSVWFLAAIHRPGDPERLVIKLRNNSDEEAENVPIKLNINGQQKALGSLSIQPRSTASDTLSFSGLISGWQLAELQITDYPIIFDDKFYFSFNVDSELPVLVMNGSGENPYINAVYRSDPFFRVSNTSVGNINYSRLPDYSLLVLNEADQISPGLVQQLTAYVTKGGDLMIFPSLQPDLEGFRTLLQSLKTDLPESIALAETKCSGINLQHSLFKGVFDRTSRQMDLPVARKFIRYSSLNTNRQTILDLPGNDIFLNEYRLGQGKIYLSAVPLNDESSNFARHSLFVPIMYQAALLSVRNQELYHKLNREQIVELPRIILSPGETLKLKNEGFEAIPDLRQNENMSQLYVADQIRQSGNYNLLKGDSVLAVLSFNESGAESDLSYASDREIVGKFPDGKPDLISPGAGSMENTVASIDRGLSLWKLCVILALLFLAAEILLVRYLKTAGPVTGSIT